MISMRNVDLVQSLARIFRPVGGLVCGGSNWVFDRGFGWSGVVGWPVQRVAAGFHGPGGFPFSGRRGGLALVSQGAGVPAR